MKYFWCFGDGGTSPSPNPTHIYMAPGIYPVTLTVDDGNNLASQTHLITVDGNKINKPTITISSVNNPEFDSRRVSVCDVYGVPPKFVPHSLTFVFYKGSKEPQTKSIEVAGYDSAKKIKYETDSNYILIKYEANENADCVILLITVDPANLKTGASCSKIKVFLKNNEDISQEVDVVCVVRSEKPPKHLVLDNEDNDFYCTPYFWVGHRFWKWNKPRGINNFYLANGRRTSKGEYVLYRPYIESGLYDISLGKENANRQRNAIQCHD